MLEHNRIKGSLTPYRKCTKETTLIAMQLKINHNIIATNIRKFDGKILDNSKCQFCSSMDNVIHYFWFCPFTQQVILKCLDTLHMKEFRFEVWDFIFGKDDLKTDNLSLLINIMSICYEKMKKSSTKKNSWLKLR